MEEIDFHEQSAIFSDQFFFILEFLHLQMYINFLREFKELFGRKIGHYIQVGLFTEHLISFSGNKACIILGVKNRVNKSQ